MSKIRKQGAAPQGIERRRGKRMDILATFSLFATVPQKGPHRLAVHDVSNCGIGFDIDIEEEVEAHPFPIDPDQELELRLYLNQSLYLPLKVVVRRVEKRSQGVRRIGAEFPDRKQPGHMALLAFLDMLDAVGESGVLE